MLQISRRVGERILIGDDVVIEVLEVTGSAVRVGISAPRTTSIYREELWATVKRENEAAAGASAEAVAGLAKTEEEVTPCP
jgi:carbon storage regulator